MGITETGYCEALERTRHSRYMIFGLEEPIVGSISASVGGAVRKERRNIRGAMVRKVRI